MASGAGPVVFSGPLFHPSSSLAGRGPRVRDSSGNMARQKPPAANAVDFANDGDRSVICSVRNSSKASAPLPPMQRLLVVLLPRNYAPFDLTMDRRRHKPLQPKQHFEFAP